MIFSPLERGKGVCYKPFSWMIVTHPYPSQEGIKLNPNRFLIHSILHFRSNLIHQLIHFRAVQLDTLFTKDVLDFLTGVFSLSGANKIPNAAPTAAPPKKAANTFNPFITTFF